MVVILRCESGVNRESGAYSTQTLVSTRKDNQERSIGTHKANNLALLCNSLFTFFCVEGEQKCSTCDVSCESPSGGDDCK